MKKIAKSSGGHSLRSRYANSSGKPRFRQVFHGRQFLKALDAQGCSLWKINR